MEKPIIALDVDEVLSNTMDKLVEFHNITYGTHLKSTDFICYEFDKVWGGPVEETIKKVNHFFTTTYFHEIEPVIGALQILQELKKYFTLKVVTARPKKLSDATIEWIERNFPQLVDEFHFCNFYSVDGVVRSKADILKEIGACLLIDDSLKNTSECSKHGIPSILFGEYAWNSLPINNNNGHTGSTILSEAIGGDSIGGLRASQSSLSSSSTETETGGSSSVSVQFTTLEEMTSLPSFASPFSAFPSPSISPAPSPSQSLKTFSLSSSSSSEDSPPSPSDSFKSDHLPLPLPLPPSLTPSPSSSLSLLYNPLTPIPPIRAKDWSQVTPIVRHLFPQVFSPPSSSSDEDFSSSPSSSTSPSVPTLTLTPTLSVSLNPTEGSEEDDDETAPAKHNT